MPATGADAPAADEIYVPGNPGYFAIFVPPEYPPEAIASKQEATLDVSGTARADGVFDIVSIQGQGLTPAFEAAIRDVARFWFALPAAENGCQPTSKPVIVRIWFELKEGNKPSISISRAAREAKPWITKPLKKVNPRYPRKAVESGTHGLVEVYARIGKDGLVQKIFFVDPSAKLHKAFAREIESSFSEWRFEPFDGQEYTCASYEILFEFR
jgi:outer membrane biosynthesis protein TonB